MSSRNPIAEYLTPVELAGFLNVSERTLSRWAKNQSGPARTRVGRCFLYRREAVMSWLESKEERQSGREEEV